MPLLWFDGGTLSTLVTWKVDDKYPGSKKSFITFFIGILMMSLSICEDITTYKDIDPKVVHHWYLCPTLQIAMKWLREVHNIAIETEWEHLWYAYIKPMTSKPSEEDCYQCGSSRYEEACETAIRYSLENLI